MALTFVTVLGACSGDDDDDAEEAAEEAAEDAAEEIADDAAGTEGEDAGGDDAAEELAAMQTSLDEAEATVEQQQAAIADLTAERDEAQAANEELTSELAGETARADEAEGRLQEIAELFPVTVTASLDEFDLIGPYTLSMTEAFCSALPNCGTARPDVRADIVQGPDGLLLQVPTVLEAGLFLIEGSLFAVTGSNLILPACEGAPRDAQVSITIFADGVAIDDDGTRELTGLGASLMVAANPADPCGAGDVFFDATLTPV